MHDLVDLHLHSTFSDGVLSPSELVAEAAALGLRAIALSDHDNVDGIPEALAAGLQYGVEVIPAVELSTVRDDLHDLHLLGYAFDYQNAALQKALGEFRDFRAGRSERILVNINRQLTTEGRQPLDPADVRRRAEGTIGRPHIGQALVDAGYVRNKDEAFTRYLVPCNEPKRLFPLQEAICLVHDAGGCTVLAVAHNIVEAVRAAVCSCMLIGYSATVGGDGSAGTLGYDRNCEGVAVRVAVVVEDIDVRGIANFE